WHADDQPCAAQGFVLDLGLEPANGRVGEPMAMTATVSGAGNVALWPEPAIRWPPGFRPYPGETGMRIAPRDGRIAGTKVFHYLVMPDSAGSFLLPEVRYPYYDLVAGDYRAATIAPRALAVAPGIEPHAARALPPLWRGGAAAWVDELARGLVPWGWLALLVGPPLLVWLRRRRGGALGARGADAVRRGPDAECGSVVRRGRAARRGRLVRGARGRLAARAGALVQPRRHVVPRRRGRQGHRGLDAGRPARAA